MEEVQFLQPSIGKDAAGDDIEREVQVGQSRKAAEQVERKWWILSGLLCALVPEVHYGSKTLPVQGTNLRAILLGSFNF